MTTARSLRRALTVLLGTVALLLSVSAAALAQIPTELPTELPTDLPTEQPTEDPAPSEEPSDPPSEPASGSSGGGGGGGGATTGSGSSGAGGPQEQPTGGSTPPQDPEAQPAAPRGGTADLGSVGVVSGGGESDAPVAPEPQVAPGRGSTAGGDATPTGGATGAGTDVLATSPALAAAIPGAYTLTVLAALLGVGVISLTFTLTDRGLLLAHDPATGGTNVERTRRWRVMAGTGLLAAAAIVAIIGYLRISIETLVPVQLVYLASAGFGVVVLAAAGGALLISEQLRADETRIRDLEDSIAMLGERLAPAVSEPPRLLDRSAQREAS